MKSIVFFLVALSLLGAASLPRANAQIAGSFDTEANETDIDITITPENPDPFTPAILRLSSTVVDLNRANITWYMGRVVIQSGTGLRQIQMQTPDYGKTLDVEALIILQTGESFRKTFSFTPQDTTLLWEAVDAYVPLFYRGKKLPAREGLIRYSAIPNFLGNDMGATNTKDAVYFWQRNNIPIPSAGGYGKDSFLIKNNPLRPQETVQVTASNNDSTKSSIRSVVTTMVDPYVLFVSKNPTTGLTRTARRDRLVIDTPQAIIRAEPYFFSIPIGMQNLNLQWFMNGAALSEEQGGKDQELKLRSPDEEGVSDFRFTNETSASQYQSTSNNLQVLFTK
jgi:hypothetical protein